MPALYTSKGQLYYCSPKMHVKYYRENGCSGYLLISKEKISGAMNPDHLSGETSNFVLKHIAATNRRSLISQVENFLNEFTSLGKGDMEEYLEFLRERLQCL